MATQLFIRKGVRTPMQEHGSRFKPGDVGDETLDSVDKQVSRLERGAKDAGLLKGPSNEDIKKYAAVGNTIKTAISDYCKEVRERTFPSDEHCFSIPDKDYQELESALDNR